MERDKKLQIIAELSGEKEQNDSKFKIQNGMLRFKNRLVISKTSILKPSISQTYHDSALGGHSGFLRTYKRIARELYWGKA